MWLQKTMEPAYITDRYTSRAIIIILFLECHQLYTGRIVIDLGTITTGVVPYIVQV